jgi:GDP-L-fucose synthase
MPAATGFWTDRRVVVTGGAGFLGRRVVAELTSADADPVVIRSADYDLTKPGAAADMIADHRPTDVIHLAARVGGIGTVCSYPKFTPVPFAEGDLWNGYPEETNAPYGIAKKALLVHAQVNAAQYGQRFAFLIPTNLYGPGDKFHPSVSHVIPALIKKCVEAHEAGAHEVDVWGTGSASREYLYVDDAARAVVLATERHEGADPINLGTNHEVTIRETVETIARLVGFDGALRWDPTKPDGQPRRRVDATRAQQLLGWHAETPFEDGLRATIDWYLAHRQEAERVAA